MPKISVVLPAFNAGATLRRALGGLRAQTFTDWEALVIDDGSTDETPEIVARESEDDPRIRLYSRPHLGLVPALNFGLEKSHSPLIARHDADDFSFPTRLEEQVLRLKSEADLGLVSCLVAHQNQNPELDTRGYAQYCEWLNSVRSPVEIRRASFIESPLAHPTVVFRRKLIETWGRFADGPFPEDYELWLRWLDAGVRMAKVEKVLYVWNDSETRLSRTDPRYREEAFLDLKIRSLSRWLGEKEIKEVLIWGAGPRARKRASRIKKAGIQIRAYLDIDPHRRGQAINGVPVFLTDEKSSWPEGFILSFVGNRGAGFEIRKFLLENGRIEESDFLICS